MICICADDFGLCNSTSARIQQCIDAGVLDEVSAFANLDPVDLHELSKNNRIRLSLHLNLVEGMCMADPQQIPLLADAQGRLKHTFTGLLSLNLFHPKDLEAQVYREIRAQVLFWKHQLPDGLPFCISSHQHTHMIPAVFRALLKVLQDEEIPLTHMRIPVEPLGPFLKTPSLYTTYHPVNIAKQWLLDFLWLFSKKQAKKHNIPTAHFLGILFSGNMDERRVRKILPKYLRLAEKDGKDIDVLFHPGYWENNDPALQDPNIVFKHFYASEKRKTEFDSVMNLSERSVR